MSEKDAMEIDMQKTIDANFELAGCIVYGNTHSDAMEGDIWSHIFKSLYNEGICVDIAMIIASNACAAARQVISTGLTVKAIEHHMLSE